MSIRQHRITAVLSASALALALTACGSDDAPAEPESPESSGQENGTEEPEDPADGDEPDGGESLDEEPETPADDEPDGGESLDEEPETPADPDDVPWSVTFDGEPFEITPDAELMCFPMTGDAVQIGVDFRPTYGTSDEEIEEHKDHEFRIVVKETDPMSVQVVSVGNPFGSVGASYYADNDAYHQPGVYADVEIIDDHTYRVEGATFNLGNVLAQHDDPGEEIEYASHIIPFEIEATCPADFRDMPTLENLYDAEMEDLDGVEGPSF